MNVLLPPGLVARLTDALRHGGDREVGGILMGEHVGVDTFRITDITVQLKGGTFATFVRLVEAVLGPLRAFFQATSHQYTRFNYIGEWHSHHSFALRPSARDRATMLDIVMDPHVGARFAVLLLVKLNAFDQLEYGLSVFTQGSRILSGRVVLEEDVAE